MGGNQSHNSFDDPHISQKSGGFDTSAGLPHRYGNEQSMNTMSRSVGLNTTDSIDGQVSAKHERKPGDNSDLGVHGGGAFAGKAGFQPPAFGIEPANFLIENKSPTSFNGPYLFYKYGGFDSSAGLTHRYGNEQSMNTISGSAGLNTNVGINGQVLAKHERRLGDNSAVGVYAGGAFAEEAGFQPPKFGINFKYWGR